MHWLFFFFLQILARLTRHVSLLEQDLLTLPEHLISTPVFSVFCDTRSLVPRVVYCRALFVMLSVIFCPLYCLSFFDLRVLWYLQILPTCKPYWYSFLFACVLVFFVLFSSSVSYHQSCMWPFIVHSLFLGWFSLTNTFSIGHFWWHVIIALQFFKDFGKITGQIFHEVLTADQIQN